MYKIHGFWNPSPNFHGFQGTHGTHANAATAVVYFLKETKEVTLHYSPFESSTFSFNSLNKQFKRQIEQPKEEEIEEEAIESNETDQEHSLNQR